MVPYRTANPLRWCTYEPVTNVTRCLHLAEALQTYKLTRFQPRTIRSNVAENLGIKVVWFSVSRPINENNKYGNVSHMMPIDLLVERFGGYLYFVDQAVYPSHTSTRVLLTKTSHDHQGLREVGFNNYGSPLKRNPADGLWYHVTECLNDQYLKHAHELELGVEVQGEDLSWLYSNSTIKANDHSLANKNLFSDDEGRGCHHYNHYGQKCPSALDEDQTRRILLAKCPRIAVQNEKMRTINLDFEPLIEESEKGNSKKPRKRNRRKNKNKSESNKTDIAKKEV